MLLAKARNRNVSLKNLSKVQHFHIESQITQGASIITSFIFFPFNQVVTHSVSHNARQQSQASDPAPDEKEKQVTSRQISKQNSLEVVVSSTPQMILLVKANRK